MSKPVTDRLPRHIAIVMDGNRRWAKARHLPAFEGHRRGVTAVRQTLQSCLDWHIPVLTLYTFSSENWNRSEEEVSALMKLLAFHLRKELEELDRKGARFRALGRLDALPVNIQALIAEMEQQTGRNDRIHFNIAVNYGGRQELCDAVRQLAREVRAGRLDPEEITETQLASHLCTAGQPDPDLLIRTGGEQRISNFLLWQLAYTELVFQPVFWPDFTPDHLRAAIEEYGRRERRFGANAQ
jgi:undecaprenyl diphosphate synthase